MATAEAWFRDSGGELRSCNEGSVAFGLMSKDGSFTRVNPDGSDIEGPTRMLGAAKPNTEEEAPGLDTLTKKQLLEEAANRGVTVTDKMTKAQIVEAIEASIDE